MSANSKAIIALEWRTLPNGGRLLSLVAYHDTERATIDGWIRSDEGKIAFQRGRDVARVLGVKFEDRRDQTRRMP